MLLIALGLIVLGLHLTGDTASSQNTLKLGGKKFSIELADTDAEREQGLSGRYTLDEKRAMLFVYDKPSPACFWMKDMHFNLDMYWFDADKKLIYARRNLTPNTYPRSYCSPKPATYVLETKPGAVQPKYNQAFSFEKQ